MTFWSSDHSASRDVYLFTDAHSLVHLFHQAEEEWRGWKGRKTWASLEGEFELALEMDTLGHVIASVCLVGPRASDPWTLTASITLDAGQLSEIAKNVKRLFAIDDS